MKITWKKTWQYLLVIVVLGSGLRLYDLGNNSFVADEFLDMNSSYGYFQTGEWRAWDFNFGKPADMNINDARDERASIYKWQVAQLFHVLPPTESTARLVSVFWGVFSIVVIFWAGYFYTRKKSIGLLAAFLFAVSIAGIIFDRRLRMYAMFLPVYLAFATTLFAFFETQYRGKILWLQKAWEKTGLNFLYLLPLLVLAWVNAQVHGLSLSVIPVFGLYVFVMMMMLWKRDGTFKNKYGVTVGLGILSVICAVIFFPKLVRLGFASLVWFDDHYSYFGYVLRDFAHPLLGVLIAGFGSFVLFRRLGKEKEALFVTLSAIVPLALAVWFFRRNAGPQYIFFIQSFVLLLSAVGIYGIIHFVKDSFPHFGKKGVLSVLLLAGILLPNWGYFLEENNTYHETSSGGNPNYRKVFDYFKKNKQESDVLITRNVRNYYWSGAKVPVIDLGDEINREKFSLAELEQAMREHATGWIILSDNDYDYFSGAAEDYMKRHLIRVSNPSVRGPIDVYRWE